MDHKSLAFRQHSVHPYTYHQVSPLSGQTFSSSSCFLSASHVRLMDIVSKLEAGTGGPSDASSLVTFPGPGL